MKTKLRSRLLFIVLIICSHTVVAQDATASLKEVFKDIETYNAETSAMDSLWMGHHPKGPFTYPTPSSMDEKATELQGFVDRLLAIQDGGLSRQDYISKSIMLMDLQNQLSEINFDMYLIPMNAEGGFYNRMRQLPSGLPFKTQADYEAYLHWIPQYVEYLKGYQKLLELGMRKGLVAPKPVIQNAVALITPVLETTIENHFLYKPFTSLPETIATANKKKLSQQGREVIQNEVLGFYEELRDFLKGPYLEASPEKPGVGFLPKGYDYYEDRVRFFATMEISSDSIHRLGLQEVARIRKEMDKIIQEVEFDGSFQEFLDFLRTDPQFYAKTPQELLNYAAWLSKKAEAGLPSLFQRLYSLPFTVEPVPESIAPTYTSGRFVPGSWEHQRAGIYWVNTYQLESRPLYAMPALTLHEAVPGHHLQISLVSELDDLPEFRNRYYISAFGEGWGLYSEYLGEEMGMYTTPYEWFGRYTYEMWRACRLVVDTGIHAKGWTREKAIDYMQSNTALSLHEVRTEIDRYIGWPGQALSYKIGELKIKSLRAYSEQVLGDTFNLREFHNEILKNGSVPLEILQEEIERYVENKKNSQ